VRLRIVCTNDFLGSLAPMATSYGQLPGGHALQRAVERLRDGQPTIWADAGDFSNGGPLSTTTGGVHNFHAAGELGIEVATIGNHELDWGMEHLAEHRGALPFPLICANLDAGLPPTAIVPTAAGPVGFVGLTHPQVDAFTHYAPAADPDLGRIVPAHAERLREQGVVAVVVLIHFGVNWSVAEDGAHEPDPTPVLDLCRPFAGAVDAVVLGHTLGRWCGVVDGVPYAQPWAFGAELGVIDLDLASGDHGVDLVAVDAGEARAWTGAGRTAIAEAERTVVGDLDAPLTIDFAHDISLAHFAADALRAAAGAAGAVVPVVGMHQPAIEGVMYRWPAGPVTEADLSRFWPWTDDRSLIADVTADELEAIASFVAPEPWLAWGTSAVAPIPGIRPTVVVPRDYVDWATIQIEQLVGRPLEWRPLEVRLRDAVRTWLAGAADAEERVLARPVAHVG
jgi:2',3'-cyclic-nucleotide 2'-phosphodiesterase (5'-nucleotidase family)